MAFTNVGSTRYPQIRLRWAPTTQPTAATQTYVDITDRLRGWDWSYGRNDEIGRFEAGTGSVLLDNSDRAFDPSYAPGPYFGNIKPRKMFELVAKWATVEYPVFVAYARGFPQDYPSGGHDKVVRVDLVDAFSIIQNIDLTIGYSSPMMTSAERIEEMLVTGVGLPAARVVIDGTSAGTFGATPTPVVAELEPVTSAGTSALDHAKTVAEGAGGQLFVDRTGVVRFHCYDRRLNQASILTPSDDVGGTRFAPGVTPEFDETYLWNWVRVTGADGDGAVAITEDLASQGDYYVLSRTVGTLLDSGSDIQQIADRTILRYAQPEQRLPALPMQGALNPAVMWPAILDIEISDRITVLLFATTGDPLVLVQNVEGISHTCQPGGPWHTTLRTSPADTNTYLILNDVTFGELDDIYALS